MISFLAETFAYFTVYLVIDYLFHKKDAVIFIFTEYLHSKIKEYDDYKKLTK